MSDNEVSRAKPKTPHNAEVGNGDLVVVSGLDVFTRELERKRKGGRPVICIIDGPAAGGKSLFSKILVEYLVNDTVSKPKQSLLTVSKPDLEDMYSSPIDLLIKGVMGTDLWLEPRDSPLRSDLKMSHFQWYRFDKFDEWLKETDFKGDFLPITFNMYDKGVIKPVDLNIPFNGVLIVEGVYSLITAGRIRFERKDVETLSFIIGNLPDVHDERFIERGVNSRGYSVDEVKRQLEGTVKPQWQEYWKLVSTMIDEGILKVDLQAISGKGLIDISRIP